MVPPAGVYHLQCRRDLRVSNIVDLPNVTVSAFLPEDIFQG